MVATSSDSGAVTSDRSAPAPRSTTLALDSHPGAVEQDPVGRRVHPVSPANMAGSTTIPTASVGAYSCCSGEEVAYSENGTAPSRTRARWTMWNSGRLRISSANRSPRRTPSPRKPAASDSFTQLGLGPRDLIVVAAHATRVPSLRHLRSSASTRVPGRGSVSKVSGSRPVVVRSVAIGSVVVRPAGCPCPPAARCR